MRKIKKINDETSELKLANILKIVIDWVDAWILAVVAGRGMSKSTEIQAQRTMNVVRDMPGAPFAFITDTYVNFKTNIFPAIQTGWKRKGWHEGIHYICNQRPPQAWLDKCGIIVNEFEHTIFFWNGCVIFAGSLDRPSLLAGKSVVHIFSDEAKYQPDKKVDRAFPILRGDVTLFGHSVYFLGLTITTDMPDVSDGEYDWVYRFAKDMNKDRIELILRTFDILNDFRLKLYKEQNGKNRPKEIEKLQKLVDDWEYKWKKARHEQTFFINASSLVNIQFLTIKYLKGLIKSLGIEELKKSVFGIRPALKRIFRFYPNLSEKHFYTDGYDYEYYDRYGYNDKPKNDSRGLTYIRKTEKLELGVDVGNMKSMVIAQEDGPYYRLLKFIYTLSPKSYRELGDQFIEYFYYHENKEIDMYYDRAANSYVDMQEDAAGKVKECIEFDSSGNRTGWQVNLMSRKQANIAQDTEYEFMLAMLKEETPGIPKLRIDSINCKQVKSSLEKAPAIVKYKGKVKVVAKDKRSEKLPIDRLPMESTNPSDAVKYLLCRPRWVDLTKPRKKKANVSAGIV